MKSLAEANWTVFVHGRTLQSMRDAVARLSPDLAARVIVLSRGADTGSFIEVRAFCDELLKHPGL